MQSTEEMTIVLNILSNIDLLPEREKAIEIDRIKNYLDYMIIKGHKLYGKHRKIYNQTEYIARLKGLAQIIYLILRYCLFLNQYTILNDYIYAYFLHCSYTINKQFSLSHLLDQQSYFQLLFDLLIQVI